MKESIHKYFSIGTLQWMSFPNRSASEAVGFLAADDYFDAAELCHVEDEQERERVAQMLRQSHLRVCYGAHPTLIKNQLNPNAIDEVERQKAECALLGCLEEAAYFGAEGLAFFAGKWTEETKDQAYNQLLVTTTNLCREAMKKNMVIELEIFDYDVDKCSLIGPAPYAAQFAAEVRKTCHNFGLLADLSHIPICHEDVAFTIHTIKPYLTHFHLGNAVVTPGAPSYGDKHPRLGYPGGANDTNELLNYFTILKQEGFFLEDSPCILSMEVTPQAGEQDDIILANTKRVINRAWALLKD